MLVTSVGLEGLRLIEPRVFSDHRGSFYESYRRDLLAAAGVAVDFLQDNHSTSVRGTVRGLHFQSSPGQAKLLRCTVGAVWDVAVDIRRDSPTFGKWFGIELTAENHRQLFIPVGFAHGFSVLSELAEVQYKCSSPYNGQTECTLAWNDPHVGVDWRVDQPILSERDLTAPSWSDWLARWG
jgi:dTDP-4-dehydrorhamnose 3,5-epimerase